MMVFKRNQIVILSLILVILVAGYLQYSYKKGSSSAGKDNSRLGEAVYVDNEKVADVDTSSDSQAVANMDGDKSQSGTASLENQQKDTASKAATDFFAQAKLDKDLSRSKNKDSLKAIADDTNASSETRTKAYEEMIRLTQNSDKEMRIEALIKEKNFSDAVALFADDGSIDIVIKTSSLTDSQTAQVADIVSRQAKVDIGKIHIRSMY